MTVGMFAAVMLIVVALAAIAAASPRSVLAGVGSVHKAAGAAGNLFSGVFKLAAKPFDLPGTDGKSVGPFDEDTAFDVAKTLANTADSTNTIDRGANFAPSPFEVVTFALDVTALDHTTGDETYKCELFESDDGLSFVTTGLYVQPTAVGQTLKALGIKKRYVKLTWTLAGTTPSITFSAYLAPRPN